MAGIVANYNQVPRIRTIVSNGVFPPVGGVNVADTGLVSLPNVRGQLHFDIIVSDDPATVLASFDVVGGFGDYPQDPTQDFYVVDNSLVNCTVTAPVKNTLQISTLLAGLGGTDRQYTLQFIPNQSYPPSIQQTSVNLIGNNTLTVRITKQIFVQGY